MNPKKEKKIRLDILLTERGLAESRSLAQRIIMAGDVRVNGEMVYKPSTRFLATDHLEIVEKPPFVSRGGEKLEAALAAFQLTDLFGKVCVDVGSSTGGFTDCMLQHGAKKVYAVDVGYGVLHWSLRKDERIIVMERTNARNISQFPEPINLVTIDASFISLQVLLPVIRNWLDKETGIVIGLIKPQFEAGRAEAARGKGVIRDPEVHRKVLQETLEFAISIGYAVDGLIRSPLVGAKGNVEFLTLLSLGDQNNGRIQGLIDSVFILQ